MSETVSVAIIVAATSILTSVVAPPLIEELRDWLRRRRRANRQRRKRQIRALRETREMLALLVDAAQHTAVGDIEASERAHAAADAFRHASIWLVGQAEAIRAWQKLMVHLAGRFGQTIRAEDMVQGLVVLGQVNDALDAQEDLVNRGKQPRHINEAERAELGDVEAFASRLPQIDRYPSVVAREARLITRVLAWWKRRSRKDRDPHSER
jgi:hypothetical protein